MLARLAAHLDRRFWLYAALIAALSCWLHDALQLWAIADAGHDDQLFLRHANTILQGDWLGPYDRFTHAKPPFYPIFIAFVFLLSLPLMFAEHLAYLGASFGLCLYIGGRINCRVTALGGFVLMAFCPVLWVPDLQRVIRESLYISLTIGVVALLAYCFLPPTRRGWRRWGVLILTGLLFAALWTTREEGIWLVPSLALLLIAGIFIRWWQGGRHKAILKSAYRRQVSNFAVFLIAALIGVGSVATLNWRYYGTFRINDFQTFDFAAAYGAIVRVKDPHPHRLIPASKAKMENIFAVSPAAAEMAPALRGEVGRFWTQVSCDNRQMPDCSEIQSGWFQWAIRDAVNEAGYYKDARSTSDYYRRLREEINAACDADKLECGPVHNSMTPPMSLRLFRPFRHAFVDAVLMTLRERHNEFGSRPSSGHPANRALFADLTGHDIQPWSDAQDPEGNRRRAEFLNTQRLKIAEVITTIQRIALYLTLILAAFSTMAVLCSRIARRQIDSQLLAFALALGGAILARLVLMALVHVTAQPAINPLYLSPGIVLLPAFAICWLAAFAPGIKAMVAERRARKQQQASAA